MRLIFVFGFLSFLFGCATPPRHVAAEQPLAPGVTLTLPDAPTFAAGLAVNQLVQARYQDQHQVFQSFIQSGEGRLGIVMSVPSGPRIMRINWSGGNISSQKESIAPVALSPQRMLADLLLVYASDDVLKKALHGAVLEADGYGSRKLVQGGKVIIAVTRPADDIWNGRATLKNFAFDYELSIQSQRADP
tara:strand:+ start:9800 stop:10369 length:570 start_codon:yes stop_codon:yes gene_type:complete